MALLWILGFMQLFKLAHPCLKRASLVAQMVKDPPATQETWVQSPGWEDPLEKGMATHTSILPAESHGQRCLGGLQPMELQRVEHDWATSKKKKHLQGKTVWKCYKYDHPGNQLSKWRCTSWIYVSFDHVNTACFSFISGWNKNLRPFVTRR